MQQSVASDFAQWKVAGRLGRFGSCDITVAIAPLGRKVWNVAFGAKFRASYLPLRRFQPMQTQLPIVKVPLFHPIERQWSFATQQFASLLPLRGRPKCLSVLRESRKVQAKSGEQWANDPHQRREK